MGVNTHMLTLWVYMVLSICCCQTQEVLKIKNLTSVKFDHPATPFVEYICMGALEISLVNQSELLIGVCTPTIEDISAAIGTLAISELEKNKTAAAKLLYGSLNETEPTKSDLNWDGAGVNARIKRPEQFYQTKDAIRFIDDRSCARKVDRVTGQVTTVIGKCATTTLDIPGAVLSACYGMIYFEEKEMWVFSVVNDGLYVYKEGGTPRLILEQDTLSSVLKSSSSRQLQRGLFYNGTRNNQVWNKVKNGINLYDFTRINYKSGNLTHGTNFVRYISATDKTPIDTTARRHDKADPALGSSDGDLSVSPNGQVMALGDISLDRLFFLDIANADKNNTGQIKPLQAVCVKNSNVVENRLDNCTFSAISASGWANPTTFVAYEQKFGAFRKFSVVLPAIPTTTVRTTTSTTASTTASTATSTTSSTKTTKATDMSADNPTTNIFGMTRPRIEPGSPSTKDTTALAEALLARKSKIGTVIGCLAFLVLAAICIALASHRYQLMSRCRERTTAKAQSNNPIPMEDQLANVSVVSYTPTASVMVSKDLDTVSETQPIKMVENKMKDNINKKRNKSKEPPTPQESKNSVFEDTSEKI